MHAESFFSPSTRLNLIGVHIFFLHFLPHIQTIECIFLLFFEVVSSSFVFISFGKESSSREERGKSKHKNKLCVNATFFSLFVRFPYTTSLQIQSISFKLFDFYFMKAHTTNFEGKQTDFQAVRFIEERDAMNTSQNKSISPTLNIFNFECVLHMIEKKRPKKNLYIAYLRR